MQNRNPTLVKGKTKTDTATTAGPNPYDEGDRPTMTFPSLRRIDSIGDCSIHCNSGVYIAKPYSVAGNVLTFLVLKGNAGANAEVVVGDAINMSGITFYGKAVGE